MSTVNSFNQTGFQNPQDSSDQTVVTGSAQLSTEKAQQAVSSIYFANRPSLEDQTISADDFERLTEEGVLVKKTPLIHAYSELEITKQFNFKENGFEFCTFDEKTVEHLGNYLEERSYHNTLCIYEDVRSFLTDWGKKEGIPFDAVIPISPLQYRHTGNFWNAQKILPLAHVDFSKDQFPIVLDTFERLLQEGVEEAFEDDSIALDDVEFSEIVNVWIPLNERPSINTLALVDISTLKDPSEELKPYTSQIKLPFPPDILVPSLALESRPYHKWVVHDIKRGGAIVFNTRWTPHAAVTHAAVTHEEKEGDRDPFRHSAEARFAFVSDKRKDKTTFNNS